MDLYWVANKLITAIHKANVLIHDWDWMLSLISNDEDTEMMTDNDSKYLYGFTSSQCSKLL